MGSEEEEVEGVLDVGVGGRLVDEHLADVGEEGEIDGVADVLLVVAHQLEEGGVGLALDGRRAVDLADEARRGMELGGGEAAEHAAQVELGHQTVGHRVAVEDGLALGELPRLDGVADGVAQVERLADAALQGVGHDDALLHRHRVGHHAGEGVEVGRAEVEVEQGGPCVVVAQQAVLEHLGIARAEVGRVEGGEEGGVYEGELGLAEHADFVFQSEEVDARLAAHGGVDHGEQRGGQVDEGDAALEGGGGEPAQVGDHASAEADEAGVACGSLPAEFLPHMAERGEVFVGVGGRDGDEAGVAQADEIADDGPAEARRVVVGEDEEAVVGALGEAQSEVLLQP